jgi:beta-lactamase regulating signal transducer with metallopeptidase domain
MNALVQIGFFAVVAAVFSRFVAKAKAKHQYFFYLIVLLFCLAVPVINTLWQSSANAAVPKSQQEIRSAAGSTDNPFWSWQGHSKGRTQFTIATGLQSWILGAWGVLVLMRVRRFSRGIYRVYRLRKDASVLSQDQVRMASRIVETGQRVALLESTAIDVPVTIGIFRPAILLPSKMLPQLGEQELSAVLAHEYGHIRRRDFAAHILCEVISLPVAWHPGIGYLMSKISQTRELACDDLRRCPSWEAPIVCQHTFTPGVTLLARSK